MSAARDTAPRPTPRIGVCSWSLHPQSPADLIQKVRATGLSHIQLALDPIRKGDWDRAQTLDALENAGITILSGMMAPECEDYSTLDSIRRTGGLRPDSTWDNNLRAAEAIARIAERASTPLVTLHAGFIPHDPGDPERAKLIDRLRQVAQIFNARKIALGFETGQESADTLLTVLAELRGLDIGVNFDPANMLLYGMGDPVSSLRKLAPHVLQIHIKDAHPTTKPGTWGTETPAGKGSVDWPALFETCRATGLIDKGIDFVIERESGERRTADILAARTLVESMLQRAGTPSITTKDMGKGTTGGGARR